MKLQDFAFLADENIPSPIIAFMESQGIDIVSIQSENLEGISDQEVLAKATMLQRVVLTQDSDFGTMVYQESVDFVGIVYLKPGHFNANIHIETLTKLLQQKLKITPPFILIAENKTTTIKIRLRSF